MVWDAVSAVYEYGGGQLPAGAGLHSWIAVTPVDAFVWSTLPTQSTYPAAMVPHVDLIPCVLSFG